MAKAISRKRAGRRPSTSARPTAHASKVANQPLNRSLSDANFNKIGLKKLICTSHDGSPLAGRGTPFEEYNDGNGKRQEPRPVAVIVDHVKDENNDCYARTPYTLSHRTGTQRNG